MLARCLIASLVAIAAIVRATTAAPPIWQPYRQMPLALPQIHSVVPAQHTFTTPIAIDVPPLTDVELDALACRGETIYVDDVFDDPILTNHRAHESITEYSNNGPIEILPDDLIWRSYWAGAKEPRTSAVMFEEFSDDRSLLDVSLGGRAAMMRNAEKIDHYRWYGWELQIEGAAMLRLNLDHDWDFDSADFRFGVPLIFAHNQWQAKFAYYHLSSHVGDEFLVRNPGYMRINYSRDVLVAGATYYLLPAWRWYAEAGWAFYDDEGTDPWAFQFGVDFAQPGPTGKHGTPFFALNGHLRQEVNFGGNLVAQAGWLWRGQTGRVLRTGLHYYNGKSPQFEFFDQFEQQLGVGLWQEY